MCVRPKNDQGSVKSSQEQSRIFQQYEDVIHVNILFYNVRLMIYVQIIRFCLNQLLFNNF